MVNPTIAVIDYGMGNLRSVAKALERVGASVLVTGDPKRIRAAHGVVFPGVGSFDPALAFIKKYDLIDTIRQTIKDEKPFLGLCLGFQLLFSKSAEGKKHKGLDVIKGNVVRFEPKKSALKIPHMGWNKVFAANETARSGMFKGIKDGSYFYFVHSYYGKPMRRKVVAGETHYGVTFCSALSEGRVWGCQFHPEKSGEKGLLLLKNFVNEVKKC